MGATAEQSSSAKPITVRRSRLNSILVTMLASLALAGEVSDLLHRHPSGYHPPR